MALKNVLSTRIDYVKTTTLKGTTAEEGLAEAVRVAFDRMEKVKAEYNEKTVLIDPRQILRDLHDRMQ